MISAVEVATGVRIALSQLTSRRSRQRRGEVEVNKSPRRSLTGSRRAFSWLRMALLAAAVALMTNTPASAQDSRKVRLSVQPEYPELAKKNNIWGTARVQATIAPDGTVKDVKGLGGNPVLLQAVAEAVKKWKYEPAQAETIAILKFDFKPAAN
jgi:TonB family protein